MLGFYGFGALGAWGPRISEFWALSGHHRFRARGFRFSWGLTRALDVGFRIATGFTRYWSLKSSAVALIYVRVSRS